MCATANIFITKLSRITVDILVRSYMGGGVIPEGVTGAYLSIISKAFHKKNCQRHLLRGSCSNKKSVAHLDDVVVGFLLFY
jgi:hypothetical protein